MRVDKLLKKEKKRRKEKKERKKNPFEELGFEIQTVYIRNSGKNGGNTTQITLKSRSQDLVENPKVR